MWPFSSRHPYPRPGPFRCAVLMEELRKCETSEATALELHRRGLISNAMLHEDVFAARQAEIEAMRELRWTTEADRKQADLDMRKAWVAELPPTLDDQVRGMFLQSEPGSDSPRVDPR